MSMLIIFKNLSRSLTELLVCPLRSMDPIHGSSSENCRGRPCSELHYYVAYECMYVYVYVHIHMCILINIYYKLGSRLKISRVVKLIIVSIFSLTVSVCVSYVCVAARACVCVSILYN